MQGALQFSTIALFLPFSGSYPTTSRSEIASKGSSRARRSISPPKAPSPSPKAILERSQRVSRRLTLGSCLVAVARLDHLEGLAAWLNQIGMGGVR